MQMVSERSKRARSRRRKGGWLVGWLRHTASSRFAVFFLGLSKRRIAYSCIDLFRRFALFLPEGGAGRILCLRRFLQEDWRAEGEDSGHCGTIRTKVAIATEFKGAEEWRPMQIEVFLPYVDYRACQLFADYYRTCKLIRYRHK